MISELKPYAKYKASALQWLGSIPEHWEFRPAFGAFMPNHQKNRGMKVKTVLSLSYGRIIVKPLERLRGLVPGSFDTYQIVGPGDIVLRTIDLQNDHTSLRVGMVRNHGIITSAYLALRAKPGVNPEFGFQFLNVWDSTKAIYGYGSGLRQNLNFSHFKRMSIAVPPEAEQVEIIRFLSWANARLERAIQSKIKVIALLNEQKQAIIHRAITRGLDPNVPLKPSGIPCLGVIPAHWEIRKLRTVSDLIVSNVDKHSQPNEQNVRLCNYVDVYKNDTIHDGLQFMQATATAEELNRFRIRVGDVILTKDSEEWSDIGVSSLVTYEADDLVCGYHLAIVRPRSGLILGNFIHRALQDKFVATQMHVRAKGVTRYGLGHSAIKDVLLPLPPLGEQAQICNHLNLDLSTFLITETQLEREISLLREYRTRLIADVVTGKLDVREAATRLPDDIPLDTTADEDLGDDTEMTGQEASE